MKKLLLLLLIPFLMGAAPARLYDYVPNTTIVSDQVEANEDSIFSYLQKGVSVYEDGTIVNADINSSAAIDDTKLDLATVAQNVIFNGTVEFNAATDFAGTTIADLGTITTADFTDATFTNITDLGEVDTTAAITLGGKLTAGTEEIEGSNFDIDGGDITSVTVGILTWSHNQDINDVNFTNVDIDSGAIDGTTIGAASAAAATVTTLAATGPLTVTQSGDDAHLNLAGDPTNSSPADGDLWFTGSALNFRNGSSTTDLLASGNELFTSSGTFTVPSGVTKVYVTMIAGGGGGGGCQNGSGGGGASGAYIINHHHTVTPAAELTVTVGAAGSAGSSAGGDGGSGGNTVFDSLTVVGGSGGQGSAAGSPDGTGATGAGGDASGATPALGGTGGSGGNGSGNTGGGGGSSPLGIGGAGGSSSAGTAAAANTGAGGGGAANTGDNHSGGAGGTGFVFVQW